MPFQQMSHNDQRCRLAYRVLTEGRSIAQTAREFGVSRPTAYLWVKRALEGAESKGMDGDEGDEAIPAVPLSEKLVEQLSERSRRPHHSPAKTETTSPEIEEAIRQCRALHPRWGARKLHAVLWPSPQAAPISVRTTHRLLARQGLLCKDIPGTAPTCSLSEGKGRFERENCNELWQVDYKGVGSSGFAAPLSVIDDCSRFCLALTPVAAKTGEEAWRVLWEVFGEYGLPECLLCDNGDGFNNTRSLGPTWLQARLWRLGVRTTHGRARHPQTQGKVERFHRTLSVEVGLPGLGDRQRLSQFRQCYNWYRPHEALEMRVPGSLYQPSSRARPANLPAAEASWSCSGALVRKVDSCGKMSYGNRRYHPGRGLAGEWVELREEAKGMAAFYAGVRFAALNDLLLA